MVDGVGQGGGAAIKQLRALELDSGVRQAGRQTGRQTTGRKLHGTRPHGPGYSTALRLGLKGPVLRRDDSDCVMAWQVCVYGLGWGAVGGVGGVGGAATVLLQLWTCEV